MPCPPAAAPAPFPVKGVAPAANPRPCATFETRGAVSSVDNGLEGAVLVDSGAGNVAFHGDIYGRRGDDYRIPSYPYLFVPGLPFDGKQPNSQYRFDGGSVGGSYVFDGGYAGVAVIQNNGLYHIPTIEGAATNSRIDAQQTKVLSKGE